MNVNQNMRPLATLKNRKMELHVFDMPARLGRNDNAVDIYFFHESVSREHCVFECINGRYTITDLGSTVGTFIEGVKLEPHVPYNIEDGAKMRIGKVKFTFHADYGELAARNQSYAPINSAPSYPNQNPFSTETKKEYEEIVNSYPRKSTGFVTVSAKELNTFEYNEEEVVYIDCGIEVQDKPMSYTSHLKKEEIQNALKESQEEADAFSDIDINSDTEDDMKMTQKIDLSDLEEDTGEIPTEETNQSSEEVENIGNGAEKSVYLMWIDDESGETKNLIINRFPFYMGRKSTENDYAIAKKGFSRKHMHFEESNGEYFICDDNSTNGIKLNGEPIESDTKIKIEAGDRMRIAGITFFIDIK